MEEYFLNNRNIERFIQPEKFELKEKDSNFWNFFIAWKGLAEYEKLRLFKTTMITEKQLKMEFQDKISARKDLKRMKGLAVAVSNLSENITLDTVVLLAFLEGVNILFLNKHSYYVCNNGDSDYTIFGKNETTNNIKTFIKDKVERHSVTRVLKSISNYKLKELQDMYIGDYGKKTKQNLYDEITEY